MPTEFEKLLKKGANRRRWPHSAGATTVVAGMVVLAVSLFALAVARMDRASDDRTDGPRVIVGGDAWNNSDAKETSQQAVPFGGLSGRVTHVRDGDTIEVRGVPIRLAKLDCAEIGTIRGDAATRKMKALVRGETVTCRPNGERSYDRKVGTCRLGDGRDIGQAMVPNGACRWWR